MQPHDPTPPPERRARLLRERAARPRPVSRPDDPPRPLTVEELLRHRPYLERLAASWSKDGQTADDLVQDTLLAALERPPREPGALRRWLAVTLGNRARNQAARRSVREALLADPDAHGAARDDVPRESEVCVERVLRSLGRLPRRQRDVIELVYLEELDLEQAARRLGIGVEAARTRKKRGLAQMRAELCGRDPESFLGLVLGLLASLPGLSRGRASAQTSADTGGRLGTASATSTTQTTSTPSAAGAASTAGTDAGGRAFAAGEGARAVAVGGVATVVVAAALLPLALLRAASPPPEAGSDGPAGSALVASLSAGARTAGAEPLADVAPARVDVDEPGRAPAAPADPTPGVIEMQMYVEGNGAPWVDLPVALVPARPDARPVALARTDATGRVRFAGLAAGDWRLWTAHGEPQPVALGPAGARGPDGAHELCAALPAADCLPGVVVDERGAPVAGARVAVAWPGRPGEHLELLESGPDGRFAVYGLGAGLAVHAVSADGSARSRAVRADAPELAAGAELALALVPLERVRRGRVTGPEGAPVEGARVTLWSDALAPATARTDAAGRFELRASASEDADAVLTVRAAGHAPLRVEIASVEERNQVRFFRQPEKSNLVPFFHLRLGPPFALTGRVRRPDGTAVAGARVAVELGSGLGERAATADADGRFDLADLPRAPLTVRASAADGSADSWLGVVEPRGAALALDLVLSGAHGLAGAAVGADGVPLSGWTVAAYRPDLGPRGAGPPSAHDHTTVTDAEGRFAFPACANAAWRVELLGPPGVDVWVVDARDGVRPGARIELTDDRGRARPGRVGGVVRVPPGGAPGTRLVARGPAVAGPQRVRFDPRSGRFLQAGLPPGRYALALADVAGGVEVDGVAGGAGEVPVGAVEIAPDASVDVGTLEPEVALGALHVVVPARAEGEALELVLHRAGGPEVVVALAAAADGTLAARCTVVAGAWTVAVRGAEPVEVEVGAGEELRIHLTR